jgi:hypothetical protein
MRDALVAKRATLVIVLPALLPDLGFLSIEVPIREVLTPWLGILASEAKGKAR